MLMSLFGLGIGIMFASFQIGGILLSFIAELLMFVRYCSPCLPMFLRWLMLSGPVELLFLLFLIAVCTCSVVMFICVGCSLRTFLVVFLFVVLVL